MSEFTIADMINSANRASPSDFQASFKDVLLSKVAAAIDQKRQEVAQSYFATDDEETSVDETEDLTDENGENTDEDTTTDSEPEEQR